MTGPDLSDRMLPEADDRYGWVFERAPTALFEEDFSAVRHWINRRVIFDPVRSARGPASIFYILLFFLYTLLWAYVLPRVGARRVYVFRLDIQRGCEVLPSCCSGSEKPLLPDVTSRSWHSQPGQEPLMPPPTFGPTRQGENDSHPADLEEKHRRFLTSVPIA